MRLLSVSAAWATCACLLITIPLPTAPIPSAQAQAEPGKPAKKAQSSKNVRRCMKFQQTLGVDEESVDLQLRSQCKFEVQCSMEWELSCSSDPAAPAADRAKRTSNLDFRDQWEVNASASQCETDWEIQNVTWSCVPAAE